MPRFSFKSKLKRSPTPTTTASSATQPVSNTATPFICPVSTSVTASSSIRQVSHSAKDCIEASFDTQDIAAAWGLPNPQLHPSSHSTHSNPIPSLSHSHADASSIATSLDGDDNDTCSESSNVEDRRPMMSHSYLRWKEQGGAKLMERERRRRERKSKARKQQHTAGELPRSYQTHGQEQSYFGYQKHTKMMQKRVAPPPTPSPRRQHQLHPQPYHHPGNESQQQSLVSNDKSIFSPEYSTKAISDDCPPNKEVGSGKAINKPNVSPDQFNSGANVADLADTSGSDLSDATAESQKVILEATDAAREAAKVLDTSSQIGNIGEEGNQQVQQQANRRSDNQAKPTHHHRKNSSDQFRSVGYISLIDYSDNNKPTYSSEAKNATHNRAANVTSSVTFKSGKTSRKSGTTAESSSSSRSRLMESIRFAQMEGLDAENGTSDARRVAPLGTVMSLCDGDGDEGEFPFSTSPVHVKDKPLTASVNSIIRRCGGDGSGSLFAGVEHDNFVPKVEAAHFQAKKFRAQGQYGPAIKSYGAVLASHKGAYLPAEVPVVAGALHHLAVLHICSGSYGDALVLLGEALSMRRESLGLDHVDVASTLCELALVRYAKEEFEAARSQWTEALRIVSAVTSGPDSVDNNASRAYSNAARILNNMGCAYYESRQYDRAAEMFRRSTDLRRVTLGTAMGVGAAGALLDVSTAICNEAVAELALSNDKEGQQSGKNGDETKAISLLEEALLLQKSVLGDGHRKVQGTAAALMEVLGTEIGGGCWNDRYGAEGKKEDGIWHVREELGLGGGRTNHRGKPGVHKRNELEDDDEATSTEEDVMSRDITLTEI